MLYAPPEPRPAPSPEAPAAGRVRVGAQDRGQTRRQAREEARAARQVLVRRVSAALQRACDGGEDESFPMD